MFLDLHLRLSLPAALASWLLRRRSREADAMAGAPARCDLFQTLCRGAEEARKRRERGGSSAWKSASGGDREGSRVEVDERLAVLSGSKPAQRAPFKDLHSHPFFRAEASFTWLLRWPDSASVQNAAFASLTARELVWYARRPCTARRCGAILQEACATLKRGSFSRWPSLAQI
eukprot:2233709-Pleurochrysis_carterae.AAC.1